MLVVQAELAFTPVPECETDKGGVTPYVFIAIIAVRYQ